MYFLFRDKKWTPSSYYEMGEGEKRIVHAFMVCELEDREKALEEARGNQ